MNDKSISLLIFCISVFLFAHMLILFILLNKHFPINYTEEFLLISVITFDVIVAIYLVITLYQLKKKDLLQEIIFRTELHRREIYLKYAAQIIRHDMNSGINIYIPRGINMLNTAFKTGNTDKIKDSIKLISAGSRHSQNVYKAVREFTEIFKNPGSTLHFKTENLTETLNRFFNETHYHNLIEIQDLGFADINCNLFTIAIDNLVRNGLTYNDSLNKKVTIFRENNSLYIKDNGRGLTEEDFLLYSKPYARKSDQNEDGDGLGLAITIIILNEHNFKLNLIPCQDGTMFEIKMENVDSD